MPLEAAGRIQQNLVWSGPCRRRPRQVYSPIRSFTSRTVWLARGETRSAPVAGEIREIRGQATKPRIRRDPCHCRPLIQSARVARVVVPDCWHHVTQRGNHRQTGLFENADRALYLQLLREHCGRHAVRIVGYRLMSNHVHLPAIPHSVSGLAHALGRAHRLCALAQHQAWRTRARVAESVLLVSAGRTPSLGGSAVRGTEPGAGGVGRPSDGLAGGRARQRTRPEWIEPGLWT